MTPPSTFGQSLKHLRRQAGLTQAVLASRAGYSTPYIGMLERGERMPQASTIDVLSRALPSRPEERSALRLLERSGEGHAPRLAGSADPAPLAGRAAELAVIGRHLRGDGPPVLLLAGEPGIGKTRLLDEALQIGHAGHWTVLPGGCHRHGGQDSYAPLLQALEWYVRRQRKRVLRARLKDCAWLARLLPEAAAMSPAPPPAFPLPRERERRLVFGAVVRFLRQAAGPAGTLLVLDDLQWAGPDAIDLLIALARGNEGPPPLRIVGAYRHTDVGANAPLAVALSDLAQAGLVTQHTVPPLDQGEARVLLDHLLSGETPLALERRDQVARRTGGVPFFLVSYAQGRRSNAGGEEQDLPWSLVQSIRQRVAALNEPAREMLQAAAVIGQEAPRAVLLPVLARTNQEVLGAIEAACAARLLEEHGDRYRFAHDVIREVVEADLSAARQAMLHKRVGETLERSRPEVAAEVLAYHFEKAGELEPALGYLELAGDQARDLLAYGTAADQYRAVIRHLDRLGRELDRARIREKLGGVLAATGQHSAALETLEAAAAVYQAGGDLESFGRLVAGIGQVHMRRGTANEGRERLQAVIPTLARAGPSHGLAAMYIALAHVLFVSGHYLEQIEAAAGAAAVATAIGDGRVLAEAQGRQGVALLLLGRLDEALSMLELAIRSAETAGDLDSLCRAHGNVGVILFIRGEFQAAAPYRERALEAARRQGDPMAIARMLANRGEGALYAGDWARARADLGEALDQIRRIDETGSAAYPLLDFALLSLVEGQWEEMAVYARQATTVAEQSGDLQALRWAATLLAERDILSGEPGRAAGRLAPLLDRPGLEETDVTYLLPAMAWTRLETGDPAGAGTLATQAIERARAQQNRVILVEALRVRAMVGYQDRDWSLAETCLDEGLALARAMPYPYAEARLLHILGMVLAGRSHQEGAGNEVARETLKAALALYERLGAHADIARIRDDLGALSYMPWLRAAGVTITVGQWTRLEAVLPPARQRGRPRADDRRTLAAILYARITRCAWAGLPPVLGDGATAHRRYQQWQRDGTWTKIERVVGRHDTAP